MAGLREKAKRRGYEPLKTKRLTTSFNPTSYDYQIKTHREFLRKRKQAAMLGMPYPTTRGTKAILTGKPVPKLRQRLYRSNK